MNNKYEYNILIFLIKPTVKILNIKFVNSTSKKFIIKSFWL